MAIRRLKQIGVAGVAMTERPRFRSPHTPLKPGDTVVLKYTDGKTDTVIVRETHKTTCTGCKYAGSGTSFCPYFIDKAGFVSCLFGSASHAVDIATVLEDI